jgi:hypothetical protein
MFGEHPWDGSSREVRGIGETFAGMGLGKLLGGFFGGLGKSSESLTFSDHALQRMTERNITNGMVNKAIEKGAKYWDPKNQSVNYVLEKGFASGKDLLIGVNPSTKTITTVIKNYNLVRPRHVLME